MANKKRKCYPAPMDERRKMALLIAASILAARKVASLPDAMRNSPAFVYAIDDAIIVAEKILAHIDRRWPTPTSAPTPR
jgi:hypothetical protein